MATMGVSLSVMKAAFNFPVGPRSLVCRASLQGIMVRFDPGPFIQGQTRITKLTSDFDSLISPRGLQCETNL